MKIGTRLQISVIFSIVLAVTVGSILFMAVQSANEGGRKERIVADMVKGATELKIVTHEYLLHPVERSLMQWQSRYNSLTNLLKGEGFKGPEEKIILDRMLHNHRGVKTIFAQLTTGYKKAQGFGKEKNAISQELKHRLIAQWLVKSQLMISDTFKLHDVIHAELDTAQQRASLLIVVFLVTLAGLIVATSLWVNRSIVAPIAKLEEGTQIIGSGNLDYKVGTAAKDEIGQLSRAFDRMTEDLKKTTASIDELNKEIAERKQAEDALKESEEKYRTILASIEDGYFEVDIAGNFTFFNDSTCKILGYSKDEMIGMNNQEYIDQESAKKVFKFFNNVYNTGKPDKGFDWEFIRKDGNKGHVETSVSLMKDSEDNSIGFRGILRDVTERKQMEAELIQTRNFLQNILDSSIDGITTTDLQGNIIYASPSTKDILGYEQTEIIGKKVRSFYGNGKEDAKAIMKELTEKGELRDHEMKMIRKDGELIDINLSLSASLLKDEKGEVIGTLGIYRDITEKNKLEAQLAQAQRMEALGTLAGGIAHNFNNILMGIQGNASLILLETDPNHPTYKRLKNIEKQVQNGSKLTSQLLGYAREGRYEIKPISFNQLVKDTSDTFGMTKKDIKVHQQLADNLHGIIADQGQIEQVLLNLFVNAADAMPKGGDLFLHTTDITHKDMTDKPYKPKPGNYVLLTVRDTGVGMDKKTMERIFDPFFTTKGLAKGTGLGLASVYGIIKAHGGYIDVGSKKGRGTTFEIYLPATEKEVIKEKELPVEVLKGKETVLLVDDEDMIIDVGEQMLKTLGYNILTAGSGKEAIELYKKNRDKIDMVLLDMVMPGVGGGETYDRMKELNPRVKVLLSSGYTIDGQATEILERGCNGFIQKPFNMKRLSQGIREILDS